MKIVDKLKAAADALLKGIKSHKKKVVSAVALAGVGAYLYKKWMPYVKQIKSGYDMVANLADTVGDSKSSAYESVVKNFESSVPQQLQYLQKRLDQEFHVPTLKARVTDSALSAHEKIQAFE